MSTRAIVLLVLSTGYAGGVLHASSVVCASGPNASSLVNVTCGQTFVSNEFMNWGAPTSSGGLGEAINPPTSLGQPVDTTASGGSGYVVNDQISVTSNMLIERADNTAYAWDQQMEEWVMPTQVAQSEGLITGSQSLNTFAGQFNAPTYDSQTAPYGPNSYPYQFGDPLLGAVPNSSSPQTSATMTFDFSQALFGVAFEVTNQDGTDSSFVATLTAMDASGNIIGEYQVTDTDGGGLCPGLSNPSVGPYFSSPTVCNDAPTIQFYDPEGRIASVVLTVTDGMTPSEGLFLDGMYLDVTTPDPGPAPLIGGGLVLLALLAKRLNRPRSKDENPRV